MQVNTSRLDDNESIFFARELEHVKARTYDALYPSLKQRQIFPVSFDADPADEFISYTMYDSVGMAQIVSDYATDFKNCDINGIQYSARVRSLGAAYQYSIQEIRKAQKTGKPLEQGKANAARKAVMQLERDIAFYGDEAYNMVGWLKNPNIPNVTLANGDWLNPATTSDEIIADANLLANAVNGNSRGVHQPDTLLLPLAYYSKLASTPRSANTDKTVLSFLMENNPFIRSVDWLNELSAANSGGRIAKDMAVMYSRDPETMSLEIPQEFETFPAQAQALAFKVPVHERCGGVVVTRPLSQAMTDDIGAA
jgi:hypothetical protein